MPDATGISYEGSRAAAGKPVPSMGPTAKHPPAPSVHSAEAETCDRRCTLRLSPILRCGHLGCPGLCAVTDGASMDILLWAFGCHTDARLSYRLCSLVARVLTWGRTSTQSAGLARTGSSPSVPWEMEACTEGDTYLEQHVIRLEKGRLPRSCAATRMKRGSREQGDKYRMIALARRLEESDSQKEEKNGGCQGRGEKGNGALLR